jgi:RNA polymerase sigma factor (sigma-70 family)
VIGKEGQQARPAASDAHLLGPSATSGDFDTFVARYAGRIYSYLARRVGDQAGEDLTAVVFIEAYAARSRWHATNSNAIALPWLFGIASNVLARHRAQEARHLQLLSRARRDAQTGDDGVDDRIAASMASADLSDALDKLKTTERDVLLLFAWGELSYDEIASALDLPVGTVRSRLHRARNRLRRSLRHLDPALEEKHHG